jgi:predicted transcriptional regulator
MAIVRKYLAKDDFTKIDNFVAKNQSISDYSLRLYLFVAGFRNGFQLNDEYIAKMLNWSKSKVTRAKRDLKKADLIDIEKVDRTTYFLYIGNSKFGATSVKKYWKLIEENPELTSSELSSKLKKLQEEEASKS